MLGDFYPALVETSGGSVKEAGPPTFTRQSPSLTAKGHNRDGEIRAWFVNNRPKKDPGRRWIALDAGRLRGQTDGEKVLTQREKSRRGAGVRDRRRWCLHESVGFDARVDTGVTQLDATIATGLLRGDAGAFLLGCRPDKPCQFCDPKTVLRGHVPSCLARLAGRRPTPPLPQNIRRCASRRPHRYTACCRRTDYLQTNEASRSNESRKTTTSESWLCPSSSAKTLTLVEFDDQESEEVVKAVDFASLCVDPQRRAAAGLTSLVGPTRRLRSTSCASTPLQRRVRHVLKFLQRDVVLAAVLAGGALRSKLDLETEGNLTPWLLSSQVGAWPRRKKFPARVRLPGLGGEE